MSSVVLPSSDEKPPVLVVDDDPLNVRTFQRVFRQKLAVTGATSGEEALALLRDRTFWVAFVDYSMPGMNGLDLLSHARAACPAMGRILLTAYVDRPEIREALASGLVATMLAKPWDRDEVEAWVRRFDPTAGAKGTGGSAA